MKNYESMKKGNILSILNELFSDYGMIIVLILLIAFFSVITIKEESLVGEDAAIGLSEKISAAGTGQQIVIITSTSEDDVEMAQALKTLIEDNGHTVAGLLNGTPPQAGKMFRRLDTTAQRIDFIACTQNISHWSLVEKASSKYTPFSNVQIIYPTSSTWPGFLTRDNLRNVADRIAVIAILAIGMTLVIITAGIDLSVGSLIALSAVSVALFIQQFGGGEEASGFSIFICSLGAILVCGGMGFFSGALSTTYKITPFIATLAVMMIARGLAYKFSNVTTIPIPNESFAWIGKGRMAGIPVSVVIMVALYAGAYFVMHWTTFGRRVYAIGGNAEAARLSGVPVNRVLLMVYTICGLLAGLGGVITASNLAGSAHS